MYRDRIHALEAELKSQLAYAQQEAAQYQARIAELQRVAASAGTEGEQPRSGTDVRTGSSVKPVGAVVLSRYEGSVKKGRKEK